MLYCVKTEPFCTIVHNGVNMLPYPRPHFTLSDVFCEKSSTEFVRDYLSWFSKPSTQVGITCQPV